MVHQYESQSTKPFISACNDVTCWASRSIKAHFGAWAPTNPDAAFTEGANMYLIKNNLIYSATESQGKPVHDLFQSMPCDVTALGQDLGSFTGLYIFSRNVLFHVFRTSAIHNGITCFQ